MEDTSSNDYSEPADDEIDVIAAPDFTLTDQYGNIHTLSEYKGKRFFLIFGQHGALLAVEKEMPHIQELYEEYGLNKEDVVILVAAPNVGREGSKEDIRF